MATVKAPFHCMPAELLLNSYCIGGLVTGFAKRILKVVWMYAVQKTEPTELLKQDVMHERGFYCSY